MNCILPYSIANKNLPLVHKLPRFLDVEASSLSSKSYPIEVAWSDSTGHIHNYLINPYAVHEWTDWDYEAQQLHGISRQQCREQGVHPRWLCNKLDQSITYTETIYADGGPIDQDWIDVLFQAGSRRGVSAFKVVHSDAIMLPILSQVESDPKRRGELYDQLKYEARQKTPGHHRATFDVQYLIELFLLCRNYAAG